MSADIESKNLEAHVAACEERYKTLFRELRWLKRLTLGGYAMFISALLGIIKVLWDILAHAKGLI